MKLLTKINRRYALFSALTLLFGVMLLYLFMHYFEKNNLEENLFLTKENVFRELNSGRKVQFAPFVEVEEITGKNLKHFNDEIKDTLIYNRVEKDYDSFKQLTSYRRIGDKEYLIFVRLDNVENTDLIFSIFVPVAILLLIILLLSNFIISRINRSIWRPFYENIEKLKLFSSSGKEKLELKGAGIDEFEDLNASLLELTENARRDYGRLREFSENASHEFQTPIAVIKAKIETLLQNKIGQENSAQLHSIYKTLNRLAKLNESLTLLAKLESTDYEKKKEVDLNGLIMRMADDFSEIAEAKSVIIKADLIQTVSLFINEDLLEIILSNLFMNAVKYNVGGGSILITLNDDKLIFKNTGRKPKKDPAKMFERFAKEDQSAESSGLGLTIVKEICDANKYSIEYHYLEPYHIITIQFHMNETKI